MEDGIERNFLSLFNKVPTEEKYLYVCSPTESICNLIITFERRKAIRIMQEKKCKVEIFKKNQQNLYVQSDECL
jgi:hypothetical protein